MPKYDDLISFSMHTFTDKDLALNFEYIFKYEFTDKSLELIESKDYDEIMNVFNIDSDIFLIGASLFKVLERSITNDLVDFCLKINYNPLYFYTFDLVILVEY